MCERTHSANGIEVLLMRLDHMHDINIVEDLDSVALGRAQQIGGDIDAFDHHTRIGALTTVDHIVGLQAFGVEPTQVKGEQLGELFECEPSLRFVGQALGYEGNGLLFDVDHPRRKRIEAMGLTANNYSSQHKGEYGCKGNENEGDRRHCW